MPIKKMLPLKAIFWLVAILLGGLQAWAHRYSTSSSDTISYLDIGELYFQGKWNIAINGNWSPLYSWLLGLTISMFKPSPYWEFAVVKLTNFSIYLFALICFEFLLYELTFHYQEKISCSSNSYFKIPIWVWLVAGYILFLWASLNWIGVYCDTPDMCTAALVYLASAILLRLYRRSHDWLNFFALGIVLGFGYLSKAVMFSLAFVFLVVGMLSVGSIRRALPRLLVALLAFTFISAPFAIALSSTKGRLTYGDTGKLSYVWYVNPTFSTIPFIHWQGGPPGYGVPAHPTRKIFDNPLGFEFGTPVAGTYPPWHDPSYWNEGIKLKFNIVKQIKVLAKNTLFYYESFLGSLVFGYLILVCIGGSWASVKDLIGNWMLLIPAGAGLGAYILVSDFYLNNAQTQPSTRLIAPFIVLLFAGCFSSVRLPDSQESKRLIVGLTIATSVTIGGQLILHSSRDFVTLLRGPVPVQWQVAEGLKQLGIQPGDKVARFGEKFGYRWARLARVKIVSEITDASTFWTKDAAVKSEVFKVMARTGARAIVQEPGLLLSDSISASGWQEMGNTGYYVYPLRNNL